MLDVVPNHMAASEDENPFWRDPLMRAKFFDLDWRTGDSRRFFDIGELAGVRVEDPEVFEVVSAKAVELVRAGLVDGLRIDHPDGLANPAQYFRRLREAGCGARLGGEDPRAGRDLARLADRRHDGLRVPQRLHGALRRSCSGGGLLGLYADVAGETREFEEIAAEAKLEQARTTFDPEVDWLAARLGEAAEKVDLASALASFPSTAPTSTRMQGSSTGSTGRRCGRRGCRRGSRRSCCSRSAVTTRS